MFSLAKAALDLVVYTTVYIYTYIDIEVASIGISRCVYIGIRA